MTDLAHSGSASIPGGAEAAGATMLEKAAAAVSDCEREKGDAFDISNAMALKIVRAVLMAVRDASDDTLDGQCFRDMLDDILADGEGR